MRAVRQFKVSLPLQTIYRSLQSRREAHRACFCPCGHLDHRPTRLSSVEITCAPTRTAVVYGCFYCAREMQGFGPDNMLKGADTNQRENAFTQTAEEET